MPKIKVAVNKYTICSEERRVDALSELFIKSEALLGLNRLPVIWKMSRLMKVIVNVYAISIISILVTEFLYSYHTDYGTKAILNLFEYIIFIIIAVLKIEQLKLFYDQLNSFDKRIGNKPVVDKNYNVIGMSLYLIILDAGLIFIMRYECPEEAGVRQLFFMILISNFRAIEHFYNGYLIKLITIRLKALKPQVKYVTDKNEASGNVMQKCVGLYDTLISSFDVIEEAIKWQVATLIATSFIGLLNTLYMARNSSDLQTITYVRMVLNISHIFWICINAELVKEAVINLKAALITRIINENTSKESHRSAQALLALTRTHDMSFLLLGWFEVDVHLPVNFVGLLFTYLIVLLQFQKLLEQ